MNVIACVTAKYINESLIVSFINTSFDTMYFVISIVLNPNTMWIV